MPGILLWLSYYVLCAAGAVIVNVDMTSDAWPNAANCQTGESSSSGGTCNLRSAFELCLTVVGGEECSIELPVGADITMDSAFGPRMTVAAESNIRIKGNNATVSRIGVTELTSTELGGSFPLSTGSMTNTASATQNYKTACTEGCGGDVLSFTGCNYDNNQDTYYRLYSGTTQLALSDDYCGSVSYIQYSVADGAACAQYCLRAGCWSSATCSTTVQAFLTRYVPFNFIYYLQTAGGVSVPQLAIEDLTIHGFEGAVRLTGDIKLDLRRITFDRNQHDEGGAVYLDSNSQPVRMMDCVFTDGSALYGGRSVKNTHAIS